MKRFLSLAVAVMLLFSVFGSSVSAKTETGTKPVTSGDVVIDDDGSDGYSGDYVVIYNPSTSGYGTASTGNMSGLIETEVGEDAVQPMPAEMADRPYRIDVDGAMAEQAAGLEKPVGGTSVRTSFNVGDTHTFSLNSSYCPLPSSNVQFKVLAKGEHCYIWTPTSTASNVYPLDQIDPTFGDICAAEFDSKFDLMQSSFGNHENGSQGDGRLNILYYNIDDGWEPGQGYVAGFFSASDLYSNNMPILNIDTYPGVYYVRPSGEVVIDVTGTYNTMVHEYQHLINYSECGSADTWINECMSAAAEEICYPGSSVIPRIQSWLNYRFNDNDDWLNPPQEHEYQSAWSLHNGYSMYDWSNYLEMDDRLALYAQVSFFAQYIFTQYGNTTFRSILLQLAQGRSFPQAFQNVTGQDTSEFVGNFRVALTANTSPDLYEGIYGFVPQEGYDPSMYHDVENPFNLLAPVVFTGSSCAISAGGAINVKPVDGVYNPPAGAAGTLRYFGVSLNAEPPAPVALTDIALAPKTATIYSGTTVSLSAVREPADANNYELEWTSSAPAVATVAGNNRKAVVTGVSAGAATITVRAHDLLNDRYYTDTAVITVLGAPTLEDALNVENGTLTFDNTGSSYPWAVDLADTSGGRLAAKSTNEGVSSSRSSFSLTVNMNAGDTMTFDWKVSSESNYDILKFYVGSTEREHISGSVGWTTVSYTATATGSVTFSWEFYKDYSVNTGSDCGWVDNIFVPGYVEEPVDFLPGDIDQDGEVTVTDALLAMRYAMGLITLTDLQLEIGNVDGDETLTISDALMILRAAMGLIEL